MQKSVFVSGWAILLIALGLNAEEGMFPINQLPRNIKGLQIKPEEIYRAGGGLAGAVLMLGGGTASFVSAEGLVLTNHHVAFDAIKKNSTPQKNLLEEGFYAQNRAEELPAPGYEAFLLLSVTDVTDRVYAGVQDDLPPEDRLRKIENNCAVLEKAGEDRAQSIEARVAGLLDGSVYYLYKYQKFSDVRLVYAPPQAIGNFGGEEDNWMWPRHTGDFSFMRIYVAPDGTPTRYNSNNRPYRPTRYLTISTAGFSENDLTFIIGYPGSTNRNRLSFPIAFQQTFGYPFRIQLLKDLIAIYEECGRENKAVELQLASRVKGLYNGLKNNQGALQGFEQFNLLAEKQAQEQRYEQTLTKNVVLHKKYGTILPALRDAYAEYYADYANELYLEYIKYVTLLSDALTLCKYSEEKVKPDSLRLTGYHEYQINRFKERVAYRRIDFFAPADEQVLLFFLRRLAAQPPEKRLALINNLIGDRQGVAIEQALRDFVGKLYASTRLSNTTEYVRLFDLTAGELSQLNDPLLAFAWQVQAELDRLKHKSDRLNGTLHRLLPEYYRALEAVSGKVCLPDANRTLRFTYGKVSGYSPRDGVMYDYQTNLKGVIAKNRGAEPFDVPQKLIELAQKNAAQGSVYRDRRTADVPVAFLTDNDITGGNSGSPVFNARGELIGCAFDGNWEALINDWKYLPNLTRTISVDIRYVLFILDKFSGAGALLREMQIK